MTFAALRPVSTVVAPGCCRKPMDVEYVLLSLLLVFISARFASEAAERLGQPAVLGEIAAGIVIGPSVLGLVQSGDLLRLIAELGVLLLLLQAGMQMNLPELGRVGGDSLRVAAIGIAVPMILALVTLHAVGIPPPIGLYIASALTATSAGITARMFRDLRALTSAEARTVLGAARADDVGGLLILTVLTAVSAGGDIGARTFISAASGTVAFVLFTTVAAVWAAPIVFRHVSARARTDGTVMLSALIFTLGLALAASAVRLAPLAGAFIAGLALSRTEARDEIARKLAPLAHIFVPVFFLLIGIETRLDVFSEASLVATAAILGAVAIAGKIASGVGVRRGHAGRLLVGVAMVPRGEVALIFAGIGLGMGILDSRHYTVVVSVVVLTALCTPPVVRRLIQNAKRHAVHLATAVPEPPGGWLMVDSGQVELNAEPPDLLAGKLGFESAVLCATRQPGPWLLQWLSSAEQHEVCWDDALGELLLDVTANGNARSWRFLEVTGLLDLWLPALAAAVRERKRDPFDLEAGGDLRWDLLEQLQALVKQRESRGGGGRPGDRFSEIWGRLERREVVWLAALARSAPFDPPKAASLARELGHAAGLPDDEMALLVFLVQERGLIQAASRRLDIGTEDTVLELAAHIGTSQKVDGLYVLALAGDSMERWERDRLDELFDLLQTVLTHRHARWETSDPIELRMLTTAAALSHLPTDVVMRHLHDAPMRYLIAHSAGVISRHIRMTATPLAKHEVRLEAEPAGAAGEWIVHVAVKDRRGLLASIAGAFTSQAISVKEAFVSTWRNGNAIDVFKVRAPADIDWDGTRRAIAASLTHPNGHTDEHEPIEGVVQIDNVASPWYTILEVRALDRTGLLHKVASALAGAGLQIHTAVVTTGGDVAVDIFYVSGPNGGKLDEAGERALRNALAGKPRGWRHILGGVGRSPH